MSNSLKTGHISHKRSERESQNGKEEEKEPNSKNRKEGRNTKRKMSNNESNRMKTRNTQYILLSKINMHIETPQQRNRATARKERQTGQQMSVIKEIISFKAMNQRHHFLTRELLSGPRFVA